MFVTVCRIPLALQDVCVTQAFLFLTLGSKHDKFGMKCHLFFQNMIFCFLEPLPIVALISWSIHYLRNGHLRRHTAGLKMQGF